MSTRRINDLLNLAHVQHWHPIPTLRKPSVAEHSYRVAVIALEIAERLNGGDGVLPSRVIIESNVMRWALMHDGPETETGDIPNTAKRRLPDDTWYYLECEMCPWYSKEVVRTHTKEVRIVKIADLAEQLIFISMWGWGDESVEAGIQIKQRLLQQVEEARVDFRWDNLPAIVHDIVHNSSASSDLRHSPVGMDSKLGVELPDKSGQGMLNQQANSQNNEPSQSVMGKNKL